MDSTENRREFLNKGLAAAAGLIVGSSFQSPPKPQYAALTVQEIIDLMLKETRVTPASDTVDTVKAGSAGQVVTGIVTTMFPTVAVMESAIQRKANFIIAHEPTYFNHRDRTDLWTINTVLDKKKAWIEKNNLVLWRFHDACHDMMPDMISYGVVRKVGLLSYFREGSNSMTIPPISLKDLALQFKTKLGIKTVRVVGDLKQTCSTIGLLPGAWGSTEHINLVEAHHPDVLIVGEVSEWETTEYIRDGLKLGAPTALIVLGHSVSEEAGMERLAEWLAPKVPGIPVHHIASGDPYTWL